MTDYIEGYIRRSLRKRLLRFFGIGAGAGTLLTGILDMAASSGTGALIFRPLGAVWMALHESSLQSLHSGLYGMGLGWLWTGILLPILSVTGIVFFGCLALLFLALAWLWPDRPRLRPRPDRRMDDDPRYDRRRD